MKMHELEQGMVLKGSFDQIRSIVRIIGKRCEYRQECNGFSTGNDILELNSLHWVDISTLARWSEMDVTEIWRIAR